MKFKTIVKKEDLKELVRAALKLNFIKFGTIILVFFLVLQAFSSIITDNDYIRAFFQTFYAIAFPIGIFFIFKYIINLQMRRIDELSQSKGLIEYIYEFKENSVSIMNCSTSVTLDISYDNIKNWKESEHFLLIVTKSNNYFIIDRNDANEKNLQGFLKNKCKR
ncbi:YcxB family protein [Traorella massiliensis]|uniref:YcxB family protein n=1 Tax=Traorella massiliensis TaxID=1903263 RepID=UPI0008F929E6|nr:YcxB family protein [Traorella massiliensis]